MAVYTRQSSSGIVDGGVIEAVDLNNEFDQLAAAFLAPTFGVGTAGTDIVMTFDGETNDGVITWMEDEDLFKFSDAINVGVDDAGHDVKFFGATSGKYMEWDESADQLDVTGSLDVTGNTTMIGTLTIGVDDAGHDVKFFGDTASAYMLWDTSTDDLVLAGAAGIDLAGDIDVDGTANLDNTDIDGTLAVDGTTISLDATTSLNIDNSNTSNGITIGTATSGVPISIGHTTSEVTINDNLTTTGNVSVGGNLDVTGTFDMSDANITNIGSIALDTITNDGTDITLDSSGDIVLDAGGADITLKDDGTTFGSISQSSGELVIKSGSTPTTAITMSGANVTVAGDLTISGDDITMGTNTSGHILVADGTNFNPVAVGDLSEISTVANDDVFLAVDTSGGGLKKITRSAVVSGLASSGAISNVVEDTSPQLGANLDTNSHNILIDDAHFIGDENGNEQIIFQTTSSAVNQFDITNAATGNAPLLAATGSDSNIDLELTAKGTGHVTIKGDTNPGTIQFNCENNSHGVQLKSPAHSVGSSAVLTLPSSTGTLIGTGDSGTLPVAAIDIDGATDIGANIVDADLFIIDDGAGGTNRKVAASRIKTYIGSSTAADDISTGDAAVTLATSAGNITIDAQGNDTDIIFKGTDGSSDTTFLTLDGSDAGTAIFNHDIKIADDGQVGSASAADAMIISSGGIVTFKDDILIKDGGTIGVASAADAMTVSSAGIVTFKDDILIKDGGTIGSASDADAIAIASDGVVTMNQIPVFSAGINVSGGSIAGTLSTAAQANVTSLGTLTALTVDDVAVNGKVITMTGSTDDTAVFTVGTNGTLTIETTDTAAAAGNIQITADGTAELAGTTVTLDSGADIVLDAAGNNVTFKSGGTSILDFSNSSSDAVVTASVQDKDIIFKGDDGGSAVTALTMDMSAAGKSIFGAAAVGSTLTDTSNTGSITLDFDTYQNFIITLANGSNTLAEPTTEGSQVGQTGYMIFIQPSSGTAASLSLHGDYESPASGGIAISTGNNDYDILGYVIKADNSILLGTPLLNFG